jgi:hypothetical protein
MKIAIAKTFLYKHTNSVKTMLAKFRIKAIEEFELKKYNAVLSYIDSLCQVYKFKPGLTEKEFRNYNTEASNTIKNQNPPWITPNKLLYHIEGSKNNIVGPK